MLDRTKYSYYMKQTNQHNHKKIRSIFSVHFPWVFDCSLRTLSCEYDDLANIGTREMFTLFLSRETPSVATK